MIVSATYQENPRRIDVRHDDGRLFTVPDDMSNRDRRKLAEWEALGNTIAPYVAPAPKREVVLRRLREDAVRALQERTLLAVKDDPDAPQEVKDYWAVRDFDTKPEGATR